MKSIVEKAVKETYQWYIQSESNDARNDNLSGVLLSRFADTTEDYNWHIITSEAVPENSKQNEFVTCH